MDAITKFDFETLKEDLLLEIKNILDERYDPSGHQLEFDWLRSKAIRKIMDISPATLQNLRITGKVGYRKIMGSYYYSKTDLLNLFK